MDMLETRRQSSIHLAGAALAVIEHSSGGETARLPQAVQDLHTCANKAHAAGAQPNVTSDLLRKAELVLVARKGQQRTRLVQSSLEVLLARQQHLMPVMSGNGTLADIDAHLRGAVAILTVAAKAPDTPCGTLLQQLVCQLQTKFHGLNEAAELLCPGPDLCILTQEVTEDEVAGEIHAWAEKAARFGLWGYEGIPSKDFWLASARSLRPREVTKSAGVLTVLPADEGKQLEALLKLQATALEVSLLATCMQHLQSTVRRALRWLKSPQGKKCVWAVVQVTVAGGVIAAGVVTAQVLVVVGGCFMALHGFAEMAETLGDHWVWANIKDIAEMCAKATENLKLGQ